MNKKERVYQQVEYEFDGKVYRGSFFIEDGWVHIATHVGSKNAAMHLSGTRILDVLLMELGAKLVRIVPG